MGVLYLPTAISAVLITTKLIEKVGKAQAITVLSALSGLEHFITASLTREQLFGKGHLWVLHPIFMAFATAAFSTVPEMILADIIDYDALRHGARREGIFVVMDLNIVQIMDVVASAIPGVAMAAVGYRANGGCSCGCGVRCGRWYLRWQCPGDIGYACGPQLDTDNVPFFGQPNRVPPCTFQDESTKLVMRAIAFLIPAFCYILTAHAVRFYPIDAMIMSLIKEQTIKQQAGKIAYDPLQRTKLPCGEKKDSKSVFELAEAQTSVELFSITTTQLTWSQSFSGKILFLWSLLWVSAIIATIETWIHVRVTLQHSLIYDVFVFSTTAIGAYRGFVFFFQMLIVAAKAKVLRRHFNTRRFKDEISSWRRRNLWFTWRVMR